MKVIFSTRGKTPYTVSAHPQKVGQQVLGHYYQMRDKEFNDLPRIVIVNKYQAYLYLPGAYHLFSIPGFVKPDTLEHESIGLSTSMGAIFLKIPWDKDGNFNQVNFEHEYIPLSHKAIKNDWCINPETSLLKPDSLEEKIIEKISFEGMQYRRDIGAQY